MPTTVSSVERRQQQPAAGVDLAREAVERGAGVRVRERIHVADGRTTGDTVGEHGREPVELRAQRVSREPADLDLARLRHALKSRTARQYARWSNASG